MYDIYQSIEKIEEFIRGISFDQLMEDERTKDAILRNLQVIGEASKNLPESLIDNHPEVDWSGQSSQTEQLLKNSSQRTD